MGQWGNGMGQFSNEAMQWSNAPNGRLEPFGPLHWPIGALPHSTASLPRCPIASFFTRHPRNLAARGPHIDDRES
jgi:hypothetical protein